MFDIFFNPYIHFFISDDVFKIVHSNGEKKSYKTGEILLYPFEKPNNFYIIKSGLVKSVATDFEGKEKVLFISGKGSTLGTPSMIFLDITTQGSYTKAIEPTEVYKIQKDIFLNLVDSSKVFRNYLFISYASSQRSQLKLNSNQALFSNKKMLYEFLIISFDEKSSDDNIWYKIKHNYNQNELADILGVSKATIKRSLSDLRDENKIRTVNNRIEVKVEVDKYKILFEEKNDKLLEF